MPANASADAPRPVSTSSPQCIAMKACAEAWAALRRAGSTSSPRRETTRTRSPSPRFRRAMSCAPSSMAGSATCPNNRPSVPVRLMPCHWSRSRPVVSENGKRASRGSAGGFASASKKRARPSAVGKRPSV